MSYVFSDHDNKLNLPSQSFGIQPFLRSILWSFCIISERFKKTSFERSVIAGAGYQ
jgi:hypothetical protein